MAAKKKNANGTVEAPEPSLMHHIETITHPASPKKSKNLKIKPEMLHVQDELDSTELLKVLAEVKNGNFSVRMPIDKIGISGKICDTLNEIISLNEILVQELNLARNTIGKQGRMNHRVELPRSAKG